MTIAKLISYCIAVAMAIVIYWAQTQVSLFDSPIPQLPWGVVSLVDLYAGFTLFGLWIAYKETVLKTFFWIIMIIMIFIGSIFMIYLNNDSGISFEITIPIFIFLWTALLIVLAKFFNYKWRVIFSDCLIIIFF